LARRACQRFDDDEEECLVGVAGASWTLGGRSRGEAVEVLYVTKREKRERAFLTMLPGRLDAGRQRSMNHTSIAVE
jgi:hypothetical protein